MRTGNVHQDASLLRKALLNELNPAEKEAFNQLLKEDRGLNELYLHLQTKGNIEPMLDEYRKYSAKKGYQNFMQHIETEKTKKRRIGMIRWWYSAAAVVVLAVGLSFWWLSRPADMDMATEQMAIISPGDTKGELILPDGNKIDVNKKNLDVNVDGVKVSYHQGVLSYVDKAASKDHLDENAVPDYNKLVIPRGGENTVVLSDGTTVRLNAGSKLTYPVRFVGSERRVLLEGEAYFDVAKDEKHRFVVQTRLGTVSVLGTAFNVNAYNDDENCYTTLVRGTVKFETAGQKEITLKPGEQAITTPNGISKKQVDVEEYIGWVNGTYVFKDKTLGDIMRTFSKWYDISVYYQTPALRDLMYSGNLKRYDTINSFLDALTLTGDIRYKINGKKVLIYEIDEE